MLGVIVWLGLEVGVNVDAGFGDGLSLGAGLENVVAVGLGDGNWPGFLTFGKKIIDNKTNKTIIKIIG